MKVEQIFTSCLAEMAYYIEDNGEAAIIDPLREIQPYIEMAKADNAKIKWIFITHFHADFVSGQVDLAKKTGATIVFGPTATAEYEIHQAKDGEMFPIGDINLELLHTPGHTLESVSLVLIDKNGEKPYVFTGDCLFIGDVGRPDLAIKQGAITEEDLAGMLFDSLRNKIMPLPNDIIVYPNHGAGSSCGKNMSKETFDTLASQKEINYALRADMTKEEFVKEVLTGLSTPPQYFPKNARMNKSINKSIDEILKNGTIALDVAEFKELSDNEEVLVIDTRATQSYIDEGTIENAIWIGIDGGFAPWIGALITNIKQKIVLICDNDEAVQEVVTRLSRVGYDNTLGYLKGGISAWKKAGHSISEIKSIDAKTFAKKYNDKACEVSLDVRKNSEYLSEHVIGLENFPLDSIFKSIDSLDKNKDYYLHCAGGYRSLIASSIFKMKGIKNVTNIEGGFGAIKETELNLTEYVCPTTLL